MTDTLDIQESPETGRPMFLTVLCILTFIGAGIGILTSIWGALTLETTIANLEASEGAFGSFGSGFEDMMSQQAENMRKWGMVNHLLNVFGNVFCLLGALWMWNLKKNGFYVYVIGQIVPLVATFALLGGSGMGMFAGLAFLGALFPIAFIIMYGVNFKYLK